MSLMERPMPEPVGDPLGDIILTDRPPRPLTQAEEMLQEHIKRVSQYPEPQRTITLDLMNPRLSGVLNWLLLLPEDAYQYFIRNVEEGRKVFIKESPKEQKPTPGVG